MTAFRPRERELLAQVGEVAATIASCTGPMPVEGERARSRSRALVVEQRSEHLDALRGAGAIRAAEQEQLRRPAGESARRAPSS